MENKNGIELPDNMNEDCKVMKQRIQSPEGK